MGPVARRRSATRARTGGAGSQLGGAPTGRRSGTEAREPRHAEPPSDPAEAARALCLRLLTGAPRTRAQLAEALRRHGVADTIAAEVLRRLTEVGLIDDQAFAAAWVSSRHLSRGLGRRALSAELQARGVDRGTVAVAVSQLAPEAERTTARSLVDRRLPATRTQPAAVRARRLVAMLVRRGYGVGLAHEVVREALAVEGQRVDDGDLGEVDGAIDPGHVEDPDAGPALD